MLKNSINEMNTKQSTNSRIEQAKDRISELKDRNFEVTQSENKEKRMKRVKQAYDL